MIFWLERNYKFSFSITFAIMIAIFSVSSIQFDSGGFSDGSSFKAILYHLTAFFALSFFLSVSLIRGNRKTMFLPVFFTAFLYAVFDEIHQYFVPGRNMSFGDLILNTIGIISALIVYSFIIFLRAPAKTYKQSLSGN